MHFENQDVKVGADQLDEVEGRFGVRFPPPLRKLFLHNNGGDPIPYCVERDGLRTVVNETLPIVSGEGRETADDVYTDLVLVKKIVPPNYFPFAIDAGGDYFFVDCDSPTGTVHFFKSDSLLPDNQKLFPLKLGLDEFFNSLVPEESSS
ncbi:MAG: SMI1/KNR4 family protein [Planctomycetota bacterium]|nr:SMI1/KNR4 family protein [Planctomycetota bacterium]